MTTPLRGEVQAPGDKSISHRALLFGALASGTSRFEGLNEGADVASTARVLSLLGVKITRDGATTVVEGRKGRADVPAAPLDCGNSGTTMRLVAGWLAAQPMTARLVGDASLSARPMERVAGPLRRMGARIETTDGHAPLSVAGSASLAGIDHRSEVASAQVKSAILIAGLTATGATRVSEPVRSRDHTERLLGAMGAAISVSGTTVEVRAGRELRPLTLCVPGDPSAAAFYLCAGAIVPGSRVTVRGVSTNPTRIGFVHVLERMGARVRIVARDQAIEPVGDIEIEASELNGTTIEAAEVPSLVDEIPVLCVAAACASSPTRITGAGELRHKECDRLEAMARGLRALGVDVDEHPDGLLIGGGGFTCGGRVRSHGDHRIAMSFAVAALATREPVEVEGDDAHAISDPAFHDSLSRLGGRGEMRQVKRLRVAIDGPSASGKTTTARAVAGRLGYRYLDSGALYRALALELLRRGVDPADAGKVMDVAEAIDAGYLPGGEVMLGGQNIEAEIRTPEVAECASRLSVHPRARAWVNERLREAAADGGVVMEGRDIGTVVLPDAEVKVFLEAELPVRAGRRHQDLSADGRGESLERVQSDLETRDRRDTERAEAPLRAADGAVRIDGSSLTFEEQVEAVLQAVAECS